MRCDNASEPWPRPDKLDVTVVDEEHPAAAGRVGLLDDRSVPPAVRRVPRLAQPAAQPAVPA